MIDIQNRKETIPTDLRIAQSDVRQDDGALRLVHHATCEQFECSDFAPFTHFGTRSAARERAGGLPKRPEGADEVRLVSAWLDMRAPLLIDDVNDNHSPEHLAELIRAARPDLLTEEELAELFDMEPGAAEEYLVETLLEAGIDGLCYRNLHEDPGSLSWIILDAGQVIMQRDGPIGGSRDPWDLTEEEFTGPTLISDVFEIDGSDEDYKH
jgi:hypothetical protein